MRLLVTGAGGLVGSEAVRFFAARGNQVLGLDNDMRGRFFGQSASTITEIETLRTDYKNYQHCDVDVRDRALLQAIIREHDVDAVIHCAAQPSHDKAREIPIVDFECNALSTLYLLDSLQRFRPEAVFVYLSTNKVYGDTPNRYPLVEQESRLDFARETDRHGISETCTVDHSLHSIFGVSKLSGDLMTQEYGRTFGMKTVCLRCGCITGPQHRGVKLHGFLSYFVKCALHKGRYTVIGYKGKQVRDQIHARDVVNAINEFILHPRCGEVYNLGGGRDNSTSILECVELIKSQHGIDVELDFVKNPRLGDHKCYISDLRRFRSHYPSWSLTRSLKEIVHELVEVELASRDNDQGHS